MANKVFLLTGLAFSTLVTGCVGTGPGTEQGALAGGALGALAGGVIGHNSRGGDALGGALLGGVAGAIAGGVIGNSVDRDRGTVYGTPDERAYRVARVHTPPTPPPAPAENIPPSPAANAVLIPGYWIYDGHTFTWAPSRWEIPPPLARTYVPAHSEMRDGRMVLVPGYWQ